MSTEPTSKQTSKPASELKSTSGQAVTFDVPLELTRLDGELVTLTMTCRFKTKREWSKVRRAYADELRALSQSAVADATSEGAAPVLRTIDMLVEEGINRDAALVHQVIAGWSLPQECTVEALADLEDHFSGALNMFLEKYERAVYQGELGNSKPSRVR